MKHKPLHAFTLLELLVVLVIVGVIAAAALPNFQKFILRSRVSTMYEAATAAQFAVTNDFYNQGYVLTNVNYASGAAAFTTPSSTYITSISITTGRVTITGNASRLFNNAIVLTITPTSDQNQTISWQCCVGNTAFYDYVPSNCRC